MTITFVDTGPLVFGVVVGFVTYRTLIRTTQKTSIGDLATIITAIAGGAITKLFGADQRSFAWYAIGLACGLAIYFLIYLKMNGRKKTAKVMGGVVGEDGSAADTGGGTEGGGTGDVGSGGASGSIGPGSGRNRE
jgi:hypothetical protein